TANFINPLIALITGGVKYDEDGNPMIVRGSFNINGVEFNYGAFLSAVINFLIMAFILFLLIKGMNSLMEIGHKKKEEPKEEPKPDPQVVLLTEIRDLLKTEDGAEKVKEMLKEEADKA
ncbi:MAG: MscL family protein, partial [Oscillospiraceae bacterium]|nr:MscL family protein [Oscillospiraceae bacterium]